MQIEIPDLDDDFPSPPPPQPSHPFGPVSPSLAHSRDGSTSSNCFNASSARPFGGQPLEQDLRRKTSINYHNSPSSPSINRQPLPPRKLSVVSIRTGSKSCEYQRLHRKNGSDLVNSTLFSPNISPNMSIIQAGKGNRKRSDTNTTNNTGTSGSCENHSPLEVAIYLIIDRFFDECETKLNQLLAKPIPVSHEDDIYIPNWLGQGVDLSFDSTFESLGQISRKNPNLVINFVMRWKSRQGESIDEHSLQHSLFSSGNAVSPRRVTSILVERKGLALVYLLCRALISIVQGISRENLGEELGYRLEEIVFNSIKNADPSATTRNPNKQANMNMFAHLLGVLSNIRFASVSDRFVSEVEQMNRAALALRDQKDSEARLSHLIRGVQNVKLKIYPLEAFEETIDFISSFATIFEASHGSVVKTAIAETLSPLLAQIVQCASAEVNHPSWNKAIVMIFSKAHSMSDKPSKARYWNATVPLICSVVGAAPQDFLLSKWSETIDWCFAKLKEKATRPIMILGVIQLVWAYLHRIREGSSALNKRLEPILKSAFPVDRKNVYPAEVSLDRFASLIHYILHWQLDYGSEFVLRTLLTGSPDSNDGGNGLVAQAGADRIVIGISAALRALTSLEKNEDPLYPVAEPLKMPSHTSLNQFHAKSNIIESSDGLTLKPETLERPRIKSFVHAVGTKVLQIAAYCDRALANYSLTDDKYVSPWHDSISQRAETFDSAMIVKRHGDFAVEHPRQVQPFFDVLQTCLQAWPRTLNSSAAESAALDILFRGLMSLDVGVSLESKLCLRRFVHSNKSFVVLQHYVRFLAKPDFFIRSKAQLQKASDTKVDTLIKFWVEILSRWCEQLRKAVDGLSTATEAEQTSSDYPSLGAEGLKLVSQMEATSLVLLCSRSCSTRRSALDGLRISGTARIIIQESGQLTTPKSNNFNTTTKMRINSVANVLDEAERYLFDTILPDDLPSTEKTRLLKWKKQRKPANCESLTRLLETDNPADMTLLFIALASIFSTALRYLPTTMVHARTLLYSQLQRIYPLASEAAGVGGRSITHGNGPNPGWDDKNLLMSWSSLLISLTSITTFTDPKVGNLSIGIDNPSIANQSNSSRERHISAGEDLIKTLVPFLTSDQSPFRDATIRAMSCIHVSMYQTLLDGLSGLAHHLSSEIKMIEAQKDRSARPNGTAKIIRLFSAIGKLHESTTKFLFHAEFSTTRSCIEILLRFIRETCLFLRSRQGMEDYLTVAIRKSFLVYSERVLKKVGNQKLVDANQSIIEISSIFPHDLILDMFNLAEDWSGRHAFSTGSQSLYDARTSKTHNPQIQSRAHTPLKVESPLGSGLYGNGGELLIQSATMIATLCETAMDIRSGTSSQRRLETSRERPAVSAGRILRWVATVFERSDPKAHAEARRAFIGAAKQTSDPDGFLEHALTICWNEPDSLPLQQTLFGVTGSALIAEPSLPFREDAILAICLSRILHSDLSTRRRAFDVLKARCLTDIKAGWLSEIDLSIQSTFSGHHLFAQTSLSKAISDMKTIDPSKLIIEIGSRMIQSESHKARSLLRLMPTWLGQINLAPTVGDIGSSKVKNLLSVVLLISSTFVDSRPDEVSAIWRSLATASPLNTAAIITFLIHQTSRRALPGFVRLARIILCSMAEKQGLEIVPQDLINSLQPAKLLTPCENSLPIDSGISPGRANELDAHFPQLPARTVLSYMQASILLLGEAVVLQPLALGECLSNVLHAYVVQADHTNVTLRGQMRETLVRYVYMLRRMQQPTSPVPPLSTEDQTEKELWLSFWDFEESGGTSRRHRKILPNNLEYLVEEISRLTGFFLVDFCKQWAKVAIEWATQCPVRHVACRSLQVLRVLGLPVDSNLLAELLVRLSNTASDPSGDIQLFALEVLTTLSACVKVQNVNQTPFAQLFWTGVSCLETCNDLEFLEAIDLLKSILEPLDDANCFEIAGSRPITWGADGGPIRQLVTKGLRSSQLCQPCWSLTRQLLSLPDSCRIVDWANGGCALLYAACLPWCLHILETGVMQDEMGEIALRLAHLTSSMGMEGLSRVLVSFAKRRFRTNDDFLRQAVNGIKEYFLPAYGPDILVLYFGFLLNPLDWLRMKTLSVIKVYVKIIEPNSQEIMDLGYDILTPLLNLLQSNVTPKALEILSEPLPVKAKPVPSGSNRFKQGSESPVKKVFGKPDETGWCVPDGHEALQRTRAMLVDVLDTFANSFISETLKRPSVVEFTYDWGPEPETSAETQTQSDFAEETNESFGEMVSTLHDLSDFFGQQQQEGGSRISSSPLNPCTARVAAILSRSLSKRRANRPSLQVPGTASTGMASPATAGPAVVAPVEANRVATQSTPTSSSSSHSHSTNVCYQQHRTWSISTDYEEDEADVDDDEEEEEGRRVLSPTGSDCTDDGSSVFAFELDDEDRRSGSNYNIKKSKNRMAAAVAVA